MNFRAFCAYSALVFGIFGIQNQAFSASVQVTITDKDGKPAPDAVVVLVHAGASSTASNVPKFATVVNEKMQFTPAVTVVAQGAKVRFVNNDPWDHHVRGAPMGAVFASNPAAYAAGASVGGFELRLEGKTEGKPAKFIEVGMDKIGAQSAALLGCFLHSGMRGHIYVSDSPWAGKTDGKGQISFDDVPQGTVQMRLWHADQLIDIPVQAVSIGTAGGTATQQIKAQLPFVPRKPRAAPAASAYF